MTTTLVTVVCFNEIKTIEEVLRRLKRVVDSLSSDTHLVHVLIVDDFSTDGSEKLIAELAGKFSFSTVRNSSNRGVGYSLYQGFNCANQKRADNFVILAGNGKMSPEQIPSVLAPLLEGTADFVQGSRYIQGGGYKMPITRILGTVAFTTLVNLFMGVKLSDSTCGFRAYRMQLVNDSRLNVNQEWLFRYEMEFYLLFYAMKLKYRVVEVPVSMNYPHKRKYSKIKPLVGWWSMVRPWVYLYLGVRE